jgi:GNAT superfamily N-acetyltransferase
MSTFANKPTYQIRLAQLNELEHLQDIERAAGALFKNTNYPNLADDDPIDIDLLRRQQQAGLVWVVCDSDDKPVGFLVLVLLGGNELYIQEVSVHPSHGRHGLGKQLIETVCQWATAQGHGFVTLSTFKDVAWNAPYYARLGFVALSVDELTNELRQVLLDEETHGLPVEKRVCMRRVLT